MAHETQTIDITPEVLKTKEGRQRVDAALKHFADTTATVANEAMQFFDTWGITISNAHPELRQDLEDLRAATRSRYEAQEAMLRAISGH